MVFPYNEPVNGQYGAPMGRCDVTGGYPKSLTLRAVPFIDGGYDRGGAYWGSPANLFCAWDRKRETVRYLRAATLGRAMMALWEEFPDVLINGYENTARET